MIAALIVMVGRASAQQLALGDVKAVLREATLEASKMPSPKAERAEELSKAAQLSRPQRPHREFEVVGYFKNA